MAQFNFFILASHRSKLIELQSHFFKKIKNKDKIKIYFMTTGHDSLDGDCEQIYYQHCKSLCESGIDVEVVITTGPRNYMQKIEFAQTQEGEYSISMDEDLWMNENVIDWMIDNAKMLDDPKNLAMTPVLSNGIPTCDMFLYDFMTSDQKAEIQKMIVNTHIPNMWGANYKHLNEATVNANGNWDHNKYYELVRQIDHHYKGIHPVRINYELNKRINDIILENWDKFANAPYDKIYAKVQNLPYLCNSVFMIKAETWRKIIADKSLYRDDYDEVPLNLYREINDLNWVFVRNGYCMHTIYNTVGQHEYERKLIDDCLNKIRQ